MEQNQTTLSLTTDSEYKLCNHLRIDLQQNVSSGRAEVENETNDTDCQSPYLLTYTWLGVPVYGVIFPPVVLFTLVTNSLVCLVLLTKNMRSPTNTLLVAMAISDTLTGLFPLPSCIYFYTLGHYRDWMPYSWCYIHQCLNNYIPTIFHTASIWLTVALAIHRYVCVCHSSASKQWCTIINVAKVLVVIYVLATASQITRFLELRFVPVSVRSLVNSDVIVVGGLEEYYLSWIGDNTEIYYPVYYWFRVVFIHLVPCTLLIIMTALLVQTMRHAQARRAQLLKQNRNTESRRLADSNLKTLMLVAVVGVFLLVEFPMALLLIVMIIDNTFELGMLDAESNSTAPLVLNLCILLSYPLNFFIYCAMSRDFRKTFRRIFGGVGGAGAAGVGGGKLDHNVSTAMTTTNYKDHSSATALLATKL